MAKALSGGKFFGVDGDFCDARNRKIDGEIVITHLSTASKSLQIELQELHCSLHQARKIIFSFCLPEMTSRHD